MYFFSVLMENRGKIYRLNIFKFGYSEKATKFEKIFHLKFDATQNIRTLTKSNFVEFLNVKYFCPVKAKTGNRFLEILF